MTINSKTIQPELNYFGVFSSAFRIKAHILIDWGYRGALSRIRHDLHEETAITGYISGAITNRLRALDCPGWCENFVVKENSPVEMEGCEGKKRPLPDLVIEGTMQGRPEYIFEAKRLKRNRFGAGEYLGEDGLGCFLSGKYAARYDEAAMLGYIQDDSPTDWQTHIQKKINQKKDLNLESLTQDVEIIAAFPDEWLTIHHREVIGRSISIYHIFLDFRPAAREKAM